jgi:UDP-glucose 4-epimerase
MRILVTGNEGYIGTHLMEWLKDHEVIGLDLKSGKDILTAELPQVDLVIHLAAQPGVLASIENPLKTLETNTLGTIRLIEHYKDTKFIFASTGGAIQETIESPYGLSKFHAEEWIKMLHKNYVILRFANVYGGELGGSRSVADKFIKGDVTIFGDGSQTRTFVHVDDLINGILKSFYWDTGSYYFGSDDTHTILELARATGKDIQFEAFKKGELKHSSLKNTTPGWIPKYNIISYIKEKCSQL